jgi:hypothetical protein
MHELLRCFCTRSLMTGEKGSLAGACHSRPGEKFPNFNRLTFLINQIHSVEEISFSDFKLYVRDFGFNEY